MKIAFIGDREGKVHFNRYQVFCQYLPHEFSFFTVKDVVRATRFDVIYYASFPLYKRQELQHPRIYGSATSWKCTLSTKDIRLMSKFQKLSANNLALCKVLKKHYKNIRYIPNGVASDFFTPAETSFDPQHIKIGWVGNKDRKEKNYSILRPLSDALKGMHFKFVTTTKSMSAKKLRSRDKMLQFYQDLDFFLVVSLAEGTPNPALEAASCGVPVVATPVGNMPQLIENGVNGFLVDHGMDKILSCLKRLPEMSINDYNSLSATIRGTI